MDTSLRFLLLLGLLVASAKALRFGTDPVTVDSKILVIGRPSRLTCNYVKFRTESVREIIWYAGYNGIKAKIFHYQVTAGTKQGSTYSYIRTDETTATDSDLTIMLPEFRSPVLTISCEVEVLRDSGYGKLKNARKEEGSNITVVQSQSHQLVMKVGNELGPTPLSAESYAAVGEPLVIKCMSVGVDPGPVLTMYLNGEPWEQNHPGQIFANPLDEGVLYSGNKVTTSITARLNRVTDDMFQTYSRAMNVSCIAKFDDHIFDTKSITVKRSDGVGAAGSAHAYTGSSSTYGGSGSNPYLRDPNRSATSTNPYLSENVIDDPDQYLAPEIGRGVGGDKRPGAVNDWTGSSSSNFGSNYGSAGYNSRSDRQGKVYDHEEIHSRLLDLVDPARHQHPGIPYDFFSGYVVMISDNIDEPEQTYGSSYSSAPSTMTTTIIGRLPDQVTASFQSNYGRYNLLPNDGGIRLKMNPVEVLNTLGTAGYRVVDSTMTKTGKIMWTLEQRKFEVGGRGL